MEIKNTPPARKGGDKSKKLKKIITFFTCVVLVFVSIFMFFTTNYAYGYNYYNTFDNNLTFIGRTLEENFLQTTINQELDKLTNDGYYIVSSHLNPDIQVKQTVVRKSEANDSELKSAIVKNLDIEVLLTQLNIKDFENTYYFKTDEECKTFVNEINEISRVETTTEGITGTYKLVSSQEALQEVKTTLQKKADAAAAARAKQVQVTSRGSIGGRASSSSSYHVPLASYVYISSEYGQRWGRMHTGVDFAASAGTEIYSWKAGTVTYAGWCGGYGNFIEVKHNDGTTSRYGHCSRIAVSVGETVAAGEVIGYVGTTGNSTGNHLHFEIKVNGSFVNPLNYL